MYSLAVIKHTRSKALLQAFTDNKAQSLQLLLRSTFLSMLNLSSFSQEILNCWEQIGYITIQSLHLNPFIMVKNSIYQEIVFARMP